jgi:hypothetical protein
LSNKHNALLRTPRRPVYSSALITVALRRDLEAWSGSGSDHDDGASSSEETSDSAVSLGCDIPDRDEPVLFNDAKEVSADVQKPVGYVTPPSAVATKPAGGPPLNSHGLFDKCNFRDSLPNERGRGAFVGALLGLLDAGHVAPRHLHANRSDEAHHRWSLNRLPGCTEQLLRFINHMLVGVVGLKPFSTWRSLARCLGDTRSYLSPKHWACLELKGGGKMASVSSPWQSYKTSPRHFDQLREELTHWLLWCDGKQRQPPAASWDPCGKARLLSARRQRALEGTQRLECSDENALAALVREIWARAEREGEDAAASGSAASGGSASSGSVGSRRKIAPSRDFSSSSSDSDSEGSATSVEDHDGGATRSSAKRLKAERF